MGTHRIIVRLCGSLEFLLAVDMRLPATCLSCAFLLFFISASHFNLIYFLSFTCCFYLSYARSKEREKENYRPPRIEVVYLNLKEA